MVVDLCAHLIPGQDEALERVNPVSMKGEFKVLHRSFLHLKRFEQASKLKVAVLHTAMVRVTDQIVDPICIRHSGHQVFQHLQLRRQIRRPP